MSDPAKTPEEIEDVLASIRRLVSDHSPGPDGTMQPLEADEDSADETLPQPEALVLTPSFRVTDPEDPWVPVAASEDAADMAEELVAEIVTAEATPVNGDTDWQPDDRLASFDAVGGETVDVSEPIAEDIGDEDLVEESDESPSDEDLADLIRLDGSEAESADFESETGDDNWPEGGAEAALLTLVARREPAAEEAEAATSEVEDTLAMAEPVLDEMAEPVLDEMVEPLRAEPEADDAAPVEVPVDVQSEAVGEPMEEMQEEASDEETGAQDDVESDLGATPIFSRQTANNPENEASDDPVEAPVEDLGDTPSPFAFPETEDGILDEDTLREIIVDVVREELQGVLGQRITRNVRKMVRREIRLALAAEDLE